MSAHRSPNPENPSSDFRRNVSAVVALTGFALSGLMSSDQHHAQFSQQDYLSAAEEDFSNGPLSQLVIDPTIPAIEQTIQIEAPPVKSYDIPDDTLPIGSPNHRSKVATPIEPSSPEPKKEQPPKKASENNSEQTKNNNIEPGIPMSPPERMVTKNPDGTVLVDVTFVPYSGDKIGENEAGVPQYSIDPPVALEPGDNRAVYIDWAGVPNTLASVTVPNGVAVQDDSTIIASHSTNYENDPALQKAFNGLKNAKVGAISYIETAEGSFAYQLTAQTNFKEITRVDLPNSDFTWKSVKDQLVTITCVSAINADGSWTPEEERQNYVVRWDLIAAKKNDQNSSN